MSGFSYPQPTFISAIYNPGFYLSLDTNGYLTYDYAKTIFLDKNDYRLSYLTSITAGVAQNSKALVLSSAGSITSGITSLTMTNLTLGTNTLGATEASYLTSITTGTAAGSKAVVLSSTRTISNIATITMDTGGTGLYIPNMQFWFNSAWTNFDHSMYLSIIQGGCVAQKALVVDLNKDISGIRNFGCTGTATLQGAITCGSLTTTGTGAVSAYSLSISSGGISSSGSISATGTSTVSGYYLSAGSGGISGTLTTAAQSNITSLGSLTALTVSGIGAQFNVSAGNTTAYSLATGSHGLFIRNNSNGLSGYVGLAFLLDTSTAYDTTTPSASISCLRRSGTQYDGADIELWSKTTASQTGSLYRFGSFHGTGTGQLSVGANNGSMDLNILKNAAGASIRIGGYESSSNCFTITYSYAGSGSVSNCLQFNNYGVSGNLTLFASNNVAIGTTTNPTSKFHVLGSSANLYGSWERVQRWTNDQASQMAVELLVYNEAGGSNNTTGGGACIGTMTNDPFKIMVNGTTTALFNNSGRFMVGGNFSAEATIHSSGDVFANGCFYTKDNVDGKAKYRFNWSQANYAAIGTDSTVGAIRLGTCDANYSWLTYCPVRGGAYTNASDRRLKADIIDVPHGLAAVMRMKPRKYRMVQDQTEHVGFIAQELADTIPEAVEIGANDDLNPEGFPINPWGIDLASLTAVLCKAIQELKAEVDELSSRI